MQERTPGNGAVLGIAGAAAGAVGTLVAILMDRDSDEETRVDVEQRLRVPKAASALSQARPGLLRKKSQEAVTAETAAPRQRASEIGSQVASLATSGIEAARTKIEEEGLQGVSRQLATTLIDRSREGALRAGNTGSDLTVRASNRVTEARSQLPVLADAASRAAQDARLRGAQLGVQARERLPEVRDQVENRVRPILADLQKQAKPLVGEATTAAASVVGTVGSRAQGARAWAENEALPEVRAVVSDVSTKALEKAKGAEVKVASVSAGASGKLTAVEDRSRDAATAVAQGTKDTGAAAFWATVAGGLVFYAFLSEEQREKVKAAALRIGVEAREIYRDIQGHDEEFA